MPAFFAGLLPEGRRLSALRRAVKISADDELGLLLEVGADLVGNVSVIAGEQLPPLPQPRFQGDHSAHAAAVDFDKYHVESHIIDRVGIAGVQEKASARTIAIPAGSDSILKLSPPEYPMLVENEALALSVAARIDSRRFPVATHHVIRDSAGRSGLIVMRFDRQFAPLTSGQRPSPSHTPRPVRFAVEDASQLLGIYPADKYNISYEAVTRAVLRVARSPILAARSLALQLALAWLTGNGDLHAKNISVINYGEGWEVSPIYDIPSTIPYGDTSLALTVGGNAAGLSRKRFSAYCAQFGLSATIADDVATRVLHATADFPEALITAIGADTRTARDIRRILDQRRREWLAPQ